MFKKLHVVFSSASNKIAVLSFLFQVNQIEIFTHALLFNQEFLAILRKKK